ncbi:GmrSD restriction endonuclease domain-containing protein [Parafrankia sp. FMc2]|uniref:GmrSD restriction endonuclease domain-containing protein n=1 Tax=Parafrankia sp. FMc2 TaxID=3233196 RepID=UPI0034D7871B
MAVHDTLLEELLKDVSTGRIQLPDFQRKWKWDDERIRSLLATVTREFPLGVIMSLETGGEAQFKARPLEGTNAPDGAVPAQLLLDGQQRLTSLYHALMSSEPVQTEDERHNELSVWYYIDIVRAIGSEDEREEAIVSVPANRLLRRGSGPDDVIDLTSREKECAAGMFPLNLSLDSMATNDWQWAYAVDEDRRRTWGRFSGEVLKRINQFRVPWVKLPKETSNEAVCTVFEKVNTGGLVLNVFELLTATYAGNREFTSTHGSEFNLQEDWQGISKGLSEKYPVLEDLRNIDFLQALMLVISYHRRHLYLAEHPRRTADAPSIRCKRRDLLTLPLADYRKWSPAVTEALAWAGDFLQGQCVFRSGELPYRTQLVPLAAIRTVLGAVTDRPEALEKIVRWYWCGVFGELYGGTTESRFPKDVEQVIDWVNGAGREPDTVTEAAFQEQRLHTMTMKLSAAYKGVFALLLQQGCYDWHATDAPINADTLVTEAVDFRQIFPKAWFERAGTKDPRMASVINKTPLSLRAAKTIGGRSPATYLEMFARESGLPTDWIDDLVDSQRIDPKTLRANDFDAFYEDRIQRLLTLVEKAMGKPAGRETLSSVVTAS